MSPLCVHLAFVSNIFTSFVSFNLQFLANGVVTSTKDGQINSKCKFKKANVGATITGYKDIQSGSESALQSTVVNIGPISVAIDVSDDSFQLYDSGVCYEEDCSSDEMKNLLLHL
ncbi:unnamed protein product [Nezara viridula]|uniref:Peptidase C1A papain C-terminal domain-containing protein n=1 Tax=Nezara viridula TaxID=85310 RepID=A0A9P0HK70_NEZVI|nr:unnamed protein product [Nezara viridula]